ncbi:DUF3892 domain-containing protein [Nocardia brasiliensis]
MAIRITAVHLEGGTTHEHIASLRWEEYGNGNRGTDSRAQLVAWIEGGVVAYVDEPPAPRVEVYVRDPGAGRPKFLQTKADGVWGNNLLALPRF